MSVPIDQTDVIGLMYAARTSTQLCGPLHSNDYSVSFDWVLEMLIPGAKYYIEGMDVYDGTQKRKNRTWSDE